MADDPRKHIVGWWGGSGSNWACKGVGWIAGCEMIETQERNGVRAARGSGGNGVSMC